ncbi:hypothetical protein E6W39_17705 [Kitasatospora acidiphila]|uniref:Uncharacterized protein n=1 Tax=Kitasatospora acidiphila TaxID=2567942 RepID=A0A540W427_9ACTN|nr:hypothetical protein [Kitasatospora acidiphila]TQF03732.1 hypothetical protein E6W39_17705 [Kitasatospora acidiphila]
MSSSGLIYAVIVGAWAAYLVPMWLRRQDELNESRPTERFSTAIRLLAGRSALERRASRILGDDDPIDSAADGASDGGATGVPAEPSSTVPGAEPVRTGQPDRRARLLARRRRMVTLLFGAFALGAVIAAVAGVAFLWVPALPAVLLTLYIGHLRRLERQRCEVKLDRARAAAAAVGVRERERARAARLAETAPLAVPEEATEPIEPAQAIATAAAVAEPERPEPAGRQDLVEATDHEEWVDGLRERAAADPDSWEPVPVPLPTYVTAPVAPRVNRALDLAAPGAWAAQAGGPRTAEGPRTPLFDQYQDPAAHTRPRAANE